MKVKWVRNIVLQWEFYLLKKIFKFGETVFDPSTYKVYIHDEITPGGVPIHVGWAEVYNRPITDSKSLTARGNHFVRFPETRTMKNTDYVIFAYGRDGNDKVEVFTGTQRKAGFYVYTPHSCTIYYTAISKTIHEKSIP